LPVLTKQIESTTVLASYEGIQRLIYPRKMVSILDGCTVELAVENKRLIVLNEVIVLVCHLEAFLLY